MLRGKYLHKSLVFFPTKKKKKKGQRDISYYDVYHFSAQTGLVKTKRLVTLKTLTCVFLN